MTYSLYVVCGGLVLFVIDSIGFNIYQKFTITELGGLSSGGAFILYLFSLCKDFFLKVQSISLLKSIVKNIIFASIITIILSCIFAIGHSVFWEVGELKNYIFDFSSNIVFMIF